MYPEYYKKLADVTLGRKRADLVFKNAKIVDVFTNEIVESSVAISDGMIIGVSHHYEGIEEVDLKGKYIAPGLIDAHLHLESTMVSPGELVFKAALNGTTTFIADPHEAANVSGADGIRFIMEQTENSPANVFVMMPSCVPATDIDDNGCLFSANDMYPFVGDPRVLGLGEVMDSVSVLEGKRSMFAKLNLFKHQVIDGHAPYLTNRQLSAYTLAGINTDHEATSFEYALEEVRRGIHVHIREGSAAHNLDAIVSGIVRTKINPTHFSFCTDDKHIDDILREGHISYNVRRAIELGLDPFAAIEMATINTARLYGLKRLGAIAPGYQADLIVFDSFENFKPSAVYHKGVLIRESDQKPLPPCWGPLKHTVHLDTLDSGKFVLPIRRNMTHVICMDAKQITTRDELVHFDETENFVPHDGYLKVAAVERHLGTGKIGVAIAKGYGLQHGAVASSVSHDSHNIIVIGDNDEDMALAVNEITRVQGGYTICSRGKVTATLPLPIMGLMSDWHYTEVQETLSKMLEIAHNMGVPHDIEPFIALSFLALPVIPEIRITPRGICLVDELGYHLQS